MTIKVEQEVLLRVLETSPSSHPPLETTLTCDDGYLLVDYCKSMSSAASEYGVEKLRNSTYCDEEDEESSIFTLSTASLSDTDSELGDDEPCRRVSFADSLVTDEWTRPFTPREEVSKLYYSTEETQR